MRLACIHTNYYLLDLCKQRMTSGFEYNYIIITNYGGKRTGYFPCETNQESSVHST